MVRLKGPGMATEASGSLAETLTFSKSKGVAYLKLHQKPKQPRSQAQVSVRSVTQLLATDWRNFTPDQKNSWAALAAENSISPYNACLAFNLRQWAHFQYPTRAYPATRIGQEHLVGAITVVQRGRGAFWTFPVSSPRDGWALAIHNVPAAGQNPTRQNCVKMLVNLAIATVTWQSPPMNPGTYYYRAVLTTLDGNATYPGGNRSVVIS